ncbi:MAG TPA: isoprenylcysteine carboxylmethyltransferase family protein [Flavobacteriales bacterium]|nr:isoprenylcysteine carboxylmethyltransferase family protein [Flavobacteriales bacterium]HIN40674.1 isoprenylcysteine carboxylmethyltransferase family protein [Flavobacteriales bacterium]
MGKFITFIYGVLAYLIFLIAFLYSIGFVGNLIVPKSIDSGIETAFLQAFLVNAILLGVFAIQHSVMARPAFKKWITGIISPAIERSTYVLLSSLALLLIYWQWQPITTVVWKAENEIVAMILTGIFFLGWFIVLLSTFMINHFELFGLKQIFDNLKNKQSQSTTFQVNFFYKIVRHPIMLGFIIAFWATPLMTVGHLIFTVVTTIYIVIAVKYLEEKDLKKTLGEKYEEYQKKVPMFIPFMKPRK